MILNVPAIGSNGECLECGQIPTKKGLCQCVTKSDLKKIKKSMNRKKHLKKKDYKWVMIKEWQ